MVNSVVARAGFDILESTICWVPREISVVARVSDDATERRPELLSPPVQSRRVFDGWQRLPEIAAKVRALARLSSFGLFGTAVAATWLDAEIDGAANFFVDEDLNRAGRTHLGRPILAPVEVPRGASVFVALPELYARKVARRLDRMERAWRLIVP
jgi:hypothetical protein